MYNIKNIPWRRNLDVVFKRRSRAIKKEKNAVILAHYYVPDDVQEVADYIGDSFI